MLYEKYRETINEENIEKSIKVFENGILKINITKNRRNSMS